MPFYETEAQLTGKLPENVHCAAYKYHGRKVMLIIANYNKQAGDFTIPIKLSGCGFSGEIKAKSALNGKILPVKNNAFTIRILPENFQIVIIEPR